jgi:Mg2+/citrate symporter
MNFRITQQALLALTAATFLGVYILLPWSDPTLRSVALGALAGLVAGHLNGAGAAAAAIANPPAGGS